MSRTDQLRAELALAELEEQLAAAKAAGDDYSDIKHQLRAVREAHRQARER
jgi:hypothetical protein